MRPQRADLDHADGGGQQHAGQRGERDLRDQRRRRADDHRRGRRACVSAASLELAPARTLTAVRAIAPVAGMPPNSGAARLARPCPNSSRSGSCCWLTLIPSATRGRQQALQRGQGGDGDRGPSSRSRARPRSRKPATGRAGRRAARRCVATSSGAAAATTVAAATASSENGQAGPPARADQHDRRDRGRERDRRDQCGCGGEARRRRATATASDLVAVGRGDARARPGPAAAR